MNNWPNKISRNNSNPINKSATKRTIQKKINRLQRNIQNSVQKEVPEILETQPSNSIQLSIDEENYIPLSTSSIHSSNKFPSDNLPQPPNITTPSRSPQIDSVDPNFHSNQNFTHQTQSDQSINQSISTNSELPGTPKTPTISPLTSLEHDTNSFFKHGQKIRSKITLNLSTT